MIRILLLWVFLVAPLLALAQVNNVVEADTSFTLNEVIIHAYQHDRKLLEIPASIGYVGKHDFERFSYRSILPVMNTIAGVRMEERSPGSYRLSIRGSTLRSPFGIRNVKVYWNELPLTDPGGNTYLNLLDFSSIQQAEVIKGPGGSLYGAGTGGVVLLKSPKADFNKSSIQLSMLGGSFNTFRHSISAENSSERSNIIVQYAHQKSDSYREQSGMSRDVVQAMGSFLVDEKRTIHANLFYTDLFYQTPGGLTQAEFDDNPQQARPPAGPNPGAAQQRATVNNKTFYSGISQSYQWNDRWSNQTGIYGTFSQFENPSIRNYERRIELNFGGRTNTQIDFSKGKLNFGAEFLHGFSPINVFDNNGGEAGDVQNNDEITSISSLVFSQLEFFLPHDFFLTVGGSLNMYKVRYERLSDTPPFKDGRTFDPVFSPRLALLKKINKDFSLYGSISRGFSPPTVAELYPSTASFNDAINPEEGTNFELGTHARLLQNTLLLELSAYSFQLRETIVIRRDEDGAEFFVNAGRTSQKGVEAHLAWNPLSANTDSPVKFSPWITYTYNHYRFSDYIQGVNDFSGNKLTGVSPNILVAGADIKTRFGAYVNFTLTYTDEIPLNDANTAFAEAFTLLGLRTGYRFTGHVFSFDIFAGVDNLLDERYSLGHDLNAFGGRYFNTAAPRNYYVGLKGNINTKSRKE